MNNPSRVTHVNVGAVRTVEWQGRVITSGIWKTPVADRVAVRGVNLTGDDQADRTVHGGPDKAVYAYASEDYDYWNDEEDLETRPGLFGENLTTEGIDLSNAIVGERWVVGTTTLEIAQPRLPCYKLGIRLADAKFPKRFLAASRLGAYLRVIIEGDVGAGDVITVTDRPRHGVTLREMSEALHDPARAAALANVERLPTFWQQVVRQN